jgi:hypothetical protein
MMGFAVGMNDVMAGRFEEYLTNCLRLDRSLRHDTPG